MSKLILLQANNAQELADLINSFFIVNATTEARIVQILSEKGKFYAYINVVLTNDDAIRSQEK